MLSNTQLLPTTGFAASIFVSPSGNDSNAGTAAAPFATLGKAQTYARNQGSGATISVGAGTYYLSSPITLTGADSGISWVAQPGANPVISGGVVVTGWTASNTATGGLTIYSAPFSTGTYANHVRAIWVNGTKCVRAASPIGGYNASNNFYNYNFSAGWAQNGSSGWIVSTSASNPTSAQLLVYAQPTQLEIVTRVPNWTEGRFQVSAITNLSGGSIAVTAPTFAAWNTSNSVSGHNYSSGITFIENAFELLSGNGVAGTFYQDYTNNLLYLIPPAGVNLSTATVVVSNLEQCITAVNLNNAIIAGLTFSHTLSTLPYNSSTGYCELQGTAVMGAAQPYQANNAYTKIKGSLALTNCANVRLLRNKFNTSSGTGLTVDGFSGNIEIAGNVFEYLGACGMFVGDPFGLGNQFAPSQISIHDNVVHDIGQEFRGGVGIMVTQVDGLIIKNNLVYNTPYSGISVGLNWVNYGTCLNRDLVVTQNNVSNTSTVLSDGGGIYLNGAVYNGSVGSNYIHDLGNQSNGVTNFSGLYFDNNAAGWNISGNVICALTNQATTYCGPIYGNSNAVAMVAYSTTTDAGTLIVNSNTGPTASGTVTTTTAACRTAAAALGVGLSSAYQDLANA